VNLVPYYPLPVSIPTATIVAATAALILISAGAVIFARRYPHWPVGWFWFLGTLVPMIGVVQVGIQSHADRYMYFSIVGVGIAAFWVWPPRRENGLSAQAPRAALAAGVIVMVALTGAPRVQAARWDNTVELFGYAARVKPSGLAFQNLGA